MSVVSDFINYLLDHGEFTTAVVLAIACLIFWLIRQHRKSGPGEPTQTATTTTGQVTQVANVRAKGDVDISPEQHNG